jgi:hypothetical protein
MLARFPANGSGKPRVIGLSKPEDYGAFPSLTRTSDGALVVAWQQPEGDDTLQIRLARVDPGWR